MQEILCSGLASASPALELEKESDAAALMTVTIAAHVDPPPSPTKFSTPATAEVGEDAVSGERDTAKGPRLIELAPQILSGEPIVLPPPAGTNLPEARPITAVRWQVLRGSNEVLKMLVLRVLPRVIST